MVEWKVVPICTYQQLDVRPEDLLNGGDFRKCETYRGGGGYDQFPEICHKRLGKRAHQQFIVQLYGCPLDCPYCYVTRSGVWGVWKPYSTEQLVQAFDDSGQEVFHLMGGAPALYLQQWPELMESLVLPGTRSVVFHSDLLLTERPYTPETLDRVASYGSALFAVDIKGVTPEDYEKNTRKPFKADLFFKNLEALVEAGVNFYITYTNPDLTALPAFEYKMKYHFGADVLKDSFVIPLIDYDATPFVDIQPVR